MDDQLTPNPIIEPSHAEPDSDQELVSPSLDPTAISNAFEAIQRELDELKALVYGLDKPVDLPNRGRLTGSRCRRVAWDPA